MRTLIDATFEDGTLPDGWFMGSVGHAFEQSALRTGERSRLSIPVPEPGWRTLRVELEVEPIDGCVVSCGDDVLLLSTTLSGPDPTAHRAAKYSSHVLAAGRTAPPAGDGVRCLAFEFDNGRLRVLIDDVEMLSTEDPLPRPFVGMIGLQCFDSFLLRRVRVLGDGPVEEPACVVPSKQDEDFFLEVNVDYFDDLIKAPFTRNMFDQLFAEFAAWGVRRVHWIYYGGKKNGWWTHGPLGVGETWAKTIENVGEIMPTVVEAAHEHGIQVFGMIKPFDMGFRWSYGEGTPAAESCGKIDRIGGPVGWIADFPVQRRDLMMARKSGAYGSAINDVFTRIDLVKEDDAPSDLQLDDVTLYVSDDNATYRPYDGPMHKEEVVEDYPVCEHTPSGVHPTQETRRARVYRFDGLEIRSKYVAVAAKDKGYRFANRLLDLLHVFGEKGEERFLTYAMGARRGSDDFRAGGFEFDGFPGTPTGVFPGYDAINSRVYLDHHGVLAFARGKARDPLALLSPSFPEARQWWLSWVRDCLEAGCDGVELRVRAHHSDFAWSEYGFEQPVVDAFRERYGVDLLATDDFDRAAKRRLRGEAYTQFYRDAKKLVDEHGKLLGLHTSITMGTEPEEASSMDIHWDWRTWLQEALPQSVTLKEVWPGTRFWREIMSLARPRGIKGVFCPYANNQWGKPGGEKIVEAWLKMAQQHGCDGYQYYECASVIEGTEDGRIVMKQPALRELFQRTFRS